VPRLSLLEAVEEYAWAAASRDERFSPLGRDELPQLCVTVSVLSTLRRLHAGRAGGAVGSSGLLREVCPGVHGVYVVCSSGSGLYLPEVCERQDWDAEEFLRQVCLKAGVDAEAWRGPDARVHTFTTLSFGASRAESMEPGKGGEW
jgi:AmmeMemoRadiSam system protein A